MMSYGDPAVLSWGLSEDAAEPGRTTGDCRGRTSPTPSTRRCAGSGPTTSTCTRCIGPRSSRCIPATTSPTAKRSARCCRAASTRALVSSPTPVGAGPSPVPVTVTDAPRRRCPRGPVGPPRTTSRSSTRSARSPRSRARRRPGVSAPVVRATRAGHLDDALATMDPALSGSEVDALEAAYLPHDTSGYSWTSGGDRSRLTNASARRASVPRWSPGIRPPRARASIFR